MPHVFSQSVFEVDRVEVTFDHRNACLQVELFTSEGGGSTRLNLWRGSGKQKAPVLVVHGLTIATPEDPSRLVCYRVEQDGKVLFHGEAVSRDDALEQAAEVAGYDNYAACAEYGVTLTVEEYVEAES
jgi:hypothetical protein